MKIALVTDLHFGARNDNLKMASHQKKFYDEVFFPYLKEHNIKEIIDLGDTFDRRKYISFTSLKAAKAMFFDPLKENNIKTHMIVGNHDTVYKNTNELNSIYLLLQEYARRWRRANPNVPVGIDLLYARIRWDFGINTGSTADNFKLSNNHKPYYARLIMEKNSDLKGIFVTKKQKFQSTIGGE